jgi:hypothetical protein
MRTHYFIDDQRGFANEYMVLAADTKERLNLIERYRNEPPDARRILPITYKEARRLAISLPAYYDRTGQQHRIHMSSPASAQLDWDRSRSNQFSRLAEYTEQFILNPDER